MCKYVVVDLEMCKVPKGLRSQKYHWGSETIQIGAVLLDEQNKVIDQFNTYVAPENGQIDSFIQNLTGINKLNVKNAPGMCEALQNFMDWLPDEEVYAVSWSDTDERQIRNEVEAKNIQIKKLDEIMDNWIDCQKTFSEKMIADRRYSLAEALIAADICFDGREHDGLADAYNAALLFGKMQREPKLQLNPYYQVARDEEESHLEVSLGDLFKGIKLQECMCG